MIKLVTGGGIKLYHTEAIKHKKTSSYKTATLTSKVNNIGIMILLGLL